MVKLLINPDIDGLKNDIMPLFYCVIFSLIFVVIVETIKDEIKEKRDNRRNS